MTVNGEEILAEVRKSSAGVLRRTGVPAFHTRSKVI
jgi:hypothetical protein